MKEVEIIKANRELTNRNRVQISLLRVGAYCRVSTDSDDQLSSYKSQVSYYTDLIKNNKKWILADIYADEAITGTQVTKRTDFQRLINDCMNGDIDMVITKSISRFARNTLDTLKYVRMLKEKNIAVYFEDEKINTLTMDGELLLVVLSSVAQQEVENISSNVKKGLKMKMSRGELVGFQGCLGYDYHPEDKSITVNKKEAEIVKYIFNRYVDGAGGSVIARELRNLGFKTRRGGTNWVESTVLGIIKNEKYKGDILLGKTFTIDPISKRRLINYGEEDQFYLRNHHEPIVSEEVFEKAEKIRMKRGVVRRTYTSGTKRQKYSRKYAFSCMIECGFCGGTLTRRRWHSNTKYSKTIWHCVVSTKKGKKKCPYSKGILEQVLEGAFVESYRQLCGDNAGVLDNFMKRLEDTLDGSKLEKNFSKLQKEINVLGKKRNELVDMRLEELIDKDLYEVKYTELSIKIDALSKEKEVLQESLNNENIVRKRLKEFRAILQKNEILNEFDRYVFESIVEKVIVGGYGDGGVVEPHKVLFVYKTGITNEQKGDKFKPKRRTSNLTKQLKKMCSHSIVEDKKMYSHISTDTCGDYSVTPIR